MLLMASNLSWYISKSYYKKPNPNEKDAASAIPVFIPHHRLRL